MSMNWFRWYHGTISDPKIALISKKSKQNRSTVIAVWAALLEHASEADDRGNVAGFDAESIAVALDIEDEDLSSILAAMMAKGLIQDQRIASWSKRQPQREDGAAERAKAWRERKRTQANAGKRQEEEEEEDKDTDKDKDAESLKQRAVGEKEEQRVAQARTHAPEPHLTRSSKTRNAPTKTVIPANWTPAEATYAMLEKQGIHRAFADECLDEFRLYWTERQEQRPGWESTFVNSVRRSWERHPVTPVIQLAVNKHERVIAKNGTSIDAWLNRPTPAVIEGECCEIH